jgi:hypothetical protein
VSKYWPSFCCVPLIFRVRHSPAATAQNARRLEFNCPRGLCTLSGNLSTLNSVRECPSRKSSERSSGEIAREPQKSRELHRSLVRFVYSLSLSQAARRPHKRVEKRRRRSQRPFTHAERHPPFCHSQHAFFHLIYYNLVWRGEAQSRKGSGAHQRHQIMLL